VQFSVPHLDLYDEDAPLPPQLSLGPGQFSVSTKVQICVDCPKDRHDPEDDPHGDHGGDHPNEPNDPRWDDKPGKAQNPVCTTIELHAVGHLVGTTLDGQPALGFAVDAVELVDVMPDDLESVLECLIGQMLRAVLTTIRVPVSALRVGAFTLTPTVGPLIDTDRVLARGNL
jgi:hypothetical protein